MQIEIDPETADRIVLAALKQHLKMLQSPRFANDADTERVIAAHEELIDYYGG